jgi:hypothetical protein
MIATNDIATTSHKLTSNPFTRRSPSASGASNDFDIMHEVFQFLLDIENPSAFADSDAFADFLTDLEYISTHKMNEERHFAKKSDVISRIRARKWYSQNSSRVKKKAAALKANKAKMKKKEIMAKSDRTGEKKKAKKKYATKKHVSDERLKKGARLIVENWFTPHEYKIVRAFTINEKLDARIGEDILHYGNDTYKLLKKDGRRFKMEINRGFISQFIKLKSLCTVEDFI